MRTTSDEVGLFPWSAHKGPQETIKPWGVDSFKPKLSKLLPHWGYNCNSDPKVFYTPDPPPPAKRHPIDQRAEVWNAKLELADVRCQIMSLNSGCAGNTVQGKRYNELKQKEQELIRKVAQAEAKYWDKAYGELKEWQKLWSVQEQQLMDDIDPLKRLSRGLGAGLGSMVLYGIVGIGVLTGAGILLYKVFTSERTIRAVKSYTKPLGANPETIEIVPLYDRSLEYEDREALKRFYRNNRDRTTKRVDGLLLTVRKDLGGILISDGKRNMFYKVIL